MCARWHRTKIAFDSQSLLVSLLRKMATCAARLLASDCRSVGHRPNIARGVRVCIFLQVSTTKIACNNVANNMFTSRDCHVCSFCCFHSMGTNAPPLFEPDTMLQSVASCTSSISMVCSYKFTAISYSFVFGRVHTLFGQANVTTGNRSLTTLIVKSVVSVAPEPSLTLSPKVCSPGCKCLNVTTALRLSDLSAKAALLGIFHR